MQGGDLQSNHRSWGDFFLDVVATEGYAQMLSRYASVSTQLYLCLTINYSFVSIHNVRQFCDVVASRVGMQLGSLQLHLPP